MKPVPVTVTVYLPGSTALKTYSPSLFDLVVRAILVDSEVNVTTAALTTAPCPSITIPRKAP